MKKANKNNPWDILGIPHTASPDEIKEAYRRMAKKHHPDSGGKVSDWLEVSKAYEAIKSKKLIPILEAPSTKMLNIRLTIAQQIFGVDDIILVDGQQEELYIKVKIPPGAMKDDKFNVINDKQRYIINIKEQANPDFTRNGIHLTMYHTLDIADVLLRKPFIIQGPTGEYLEIDLPDHIGHDLIITIEGQGLLNRKTKKRGNLRIHVNFDIPIINDDNMDAFITRLKND